jgi:DNA-binding NarL/FixJ family response regulator
VEYFDGFVLDLWLPDYPGVPLCREIRAHDPHVPIVVWTVADEAELQGRAMRAGANAFLRKGPNYDVLQDTLRRLIAAADERAIGAYSKAQQMLASLKGRYREASTYATQSKQDRIAGLDQLARALVLDVYLSGGGTRRRFEQWWRRALEAD